MPAPERPIAVSPSDLRVWRERIERMNPASPPCPGLHGEAWQRVHGFMLDFLDRFGAEAVDLGWSEFDRFGVHPSVGIVRVDHCSAVVLGGREAQWIDADRVRQSDRLSRHARATAGRPELGVRGMTHSRPRQRPPIRAIAVGSHYNTAARH